MQSPNGDITHTRYEPFGTYRGGSGDNAITDRGFTGHKQNDDVGLIYMNARFYVPYINRFASADTIVPDLTNPQTFNRYSYVSNRPINFNDPSGHISCEQMPIECQSDSNGNENWSKGDFDFESTAETSARVAIAGDPYFLNPGKAINDGLSWMSEKVTQTIDTITSSIGLGTPMADENARLEACFASSNCLLDLPFFPSPSSSTIYPRGSGAAVGPVPKNYVQVSRWVNSTEAKAWIATEGTTIPSAIGVESRVYVTSYGAPKPGGTGPIRIDFYVNESTLNVAGKSEWFQIMQPMANKPIYNVTINFPIP